MTPDLMRSLDQTLGPSVCFLLTLYERIRRLFKPRHYGPVTQARRILFVKPAEMGSTVLTYSTLLRARELWPDCELYFFVFAENCSAVELLGLVPPDRVFKLRTDSLGHFIVDSFRELKKIRAMKFDVAVDMEFYSRGAAVLTYLANARASSGFERYTMEGLYKGSLLTHPVQYNCHIHTAASFASLVETLSEPREQIPHLKKKPLSRDELKLPRIAPTEQKKDEVRRLIASQNPRVRLDSRLVILNVNASDIMPLRKWPLENYIALARRLLQFPNLFIVLTGVAAEASLVSAVERDLGADRCVNLVGKTTIHSLLVLYTLSSLMVTNDSGPSHFAGLTEMPSLTLFGPETPEIYGPLGNHKVAITAGLACSPCVSSYNHRRSPCSDALCMKAISVDEVYKACCILLDVTPREN